MTPGTRFQSVLDDGAITDPISVNRVILLSGKLFYDLAKALAALDPSVAQRVALVRVEELAPFPFASLRSILRRYSNAQEVFWVQEEARNQGAWSHIEPRLRAVLAEAKEPLLLKYVGRKEDAVSAVGVGKVYRAQQDAVLQAAFTGL